MLFCRLLILFLNYPRVANNLDFQIRPNVLSGLICVPCADPESFARGGPTLTIFFWMQIALKRGHHGPASETPFEWGFAGGPMMAQH